LIGAGWTAGNGLEPRRPNGQGSMLPGTVLVGVGVERIFVVGAVMPETASRGARTTRESLCVCGECGVPVAESAVAPPGPIPNPVVTHGSAGEY
jgi:hypothetical protein